MASTVSIIGIGDVVINNQLRQPASKGTIYDRLRAADSCFANLEMPFSKDGYPAEKLIALRCDPAYAHVIRDIDIDVVTVANNHAMDYGLEGLQTTSRTLDDAGIGHAGSGSKSSEAFAPLVKTLEHGVRVAYIGVTTTLPNGSGAGRSRPGLAGVRVFTKYVVDTVTIDESPGMAPFVETETYKPDEEILLRSIADAKAQADIVLVGIHWGVPYGWVANTQDELATYQRPLARAMIDAGASAIFGHHPHVVQGVEFYQDAIIFYSLGNFVFSNDIVRAPEDSDGSAWRTYPPYDFASLQQTLSNIGALAKVNFSFSEGSQGESLRTTSVRIESCSLIPVTIAVDCGEPVEASRGDAEVLLSRLTALSSSNVGFGGEELEFDLATAGEGHEIAISRTSV